MLSYSLLAGTGINARPETCKANTTTELCHRPEQAFLWCSSPGQREEWAGRKHRQQTSVTGSITATTASEALPL